MCDVWEANKNNKDTNYQDKKSLYSCEINRYEIEKFLNTNIDYLRDNLINWRKDFLEYITKEIIIQFSRMYVKEQPYERYENITCD